MGDREKKLRQQEGLSRLCGLVERKEEEAWSKVLVAAFDQVREYGAYMTRVWERMVDVRTKSVN
jgi:hypothetical protein